MYFISLVERLHAFHYVEPICVGWPNGLLGLFLSTMSKGLYKSYSKPDSSWLEVAGAEVGNGFFSNCL